ncbi:hypothetical protein BT96DRAFT_1024838 [Gymnopus androsaceus JB14]|uniref:Uncharacterized protein n=1 Tax=Gymnopus androsaceus JB14 TaxID=1447944 RepID=A0A6A4GY28_9AGAR|nr:hypothetical protein BT96DRAFT_1024838 [Gymnopus androsaceus JB14]
MFNMFTDEIGKTIGKHQVVPCPSIGRYKSLEEPKAPRPHYLLPHRHRSPSKSHLYPLQKIEQGVETVEDKCNNNANFLVDSNIDAVVYKGKSLPLRTVKCECSPANEASSIIHVHAGATWDS